MNCELMFSSKTDLWSTPQDLFEKLDGFFSFNTDVCATSENAKCEHFLRKRMTALNRIGQERVG